MTEVEGQTIYSNGIKTNKFDQEIVTKINIMACRILHGSYSWIIQSLANIFTFGSCDPIEHQWIVLQTSQAYYTIQKWCCGTIQIKRNQNIQNANKVGLLCASKSLDSDEWIINQTQTLPQVNIKTVTNILSSLDFGSYNIFNANCQDFVNKLYYVLTGFNNEKRNNKRLPNSLFSVIPLFGKKYQIKKLN